MGVELAPIQGLIELQDDFTNPLGLADKAMEHFAEDTQAALVAVAGTVGLVVAAIGGITATIVGLGNRGADINDLTGTLEHFAGGAKDAEDMMSALRAGTMNTVDNFVLAKDAARLLSAGVKLTADDFGTLGSAAFVLQNRGLGGTKEMLDLVSDAMVTGRTRALAMKLGVVDVGDAEDAYAKKLGISKDMLSETGKVEAKRLAVMGMLTSAVKDAGAQERDFGEQLEAAQTAVTNFVDDLASSVGSSKVFHDGMKAIETALKDAFGGDNSTLIKDITHWLESAAIVIVDIGLGAVEAARMVHMAWSAIETVVLGVEEAITAALYLITEGVVQISKVGEKLHILPEGTAAMVQETADALKAMGESFDAQAAEAAKGMVGASEFDKTLDKLGGTLYQVKDAMQAAQKAGEGDSEAMKIAASNTEKLNKVKKELADHAKQAGIDQEKYDKAVLKSSNELADIWDGYYKMVVKDSGNAKESQIADIETTFDKQVRALDLLDPLYKEKYAAYRETADLALKQMGTGWDDLNKKSIESLNKTAEVETAKYNEMIHGPLHFFREEIDTQKQKMMDAIDAARGMGEAFKKAQEQGKAAAAEHKKALEEVAAAARKAREEANAKPVSFDVSSSNFEKSIMDIMTSGGWNPTAQGWKGGGMGDAYSLARKGYSFSEIMDIISKPQGGTLPPPRGPRIPGFEGGAIGDFGSGTFALLHGREAVIPLGGHDGISGRGHVVNHNYIYINDTLQDAARKTADEIMRIVSFGRHFGTA